MDGHALAMQDAVDEQDLEDLRHPAGGMKIRSDIRARGFESTEHGDFAPHALEIVDGPFHARRIGNGEIMQHRVG